MINKYTNNNYLVYEKLGFTERRLTNQNFIVRLYSSVSDKFKKKREEKLYIFVLGLTMIPCFFLFRIINSSFKI